MFQKRLIQNDPLRSQLISQPRRHFQLYGKNYLTGFDKMVVDKLSWAKLSGHWFGLLGVANLIGYGAYLTLSKDQFYYHFSYKAYPARLFKPLKSMMGSDTLANVIWTAPTLMLLSYYMHDKVGPLVMTKFFFLSLLSVSLFYSAVNPQSGLNVRPLRSYSPLKFDSFADDGSYYMGSDQMCQALIYWALLYHRMWYIALPCMALDVLYYGPATTGGPVAALAGAFMFF